jgi:Transposase, Mutator family
VGCSSIHFSTEGAICRVQRYRCQTDSARDFDRPADRGSARRRAGAFDLGGRSGSVRVSGRDRQSEDRRRLPARGAARASARAPDHDRHRACGGASAARARPGGGRRRPARIRFTPTILPPYARRSKSLDTLIPILYLKGVSTGDFGAALAALLGKDVFGLSATTIARLKDVWIDEHKQWSERDLSAKELRLRLGRRVYL